MLLKRQNIYHSYGNGEYEKMPTNRLRIDNSVGLSGPYFSFLQPAKNLFKDGLKKMKKERALNVVRKFKQAKTTEDINVTLDAFKEFENAIKFNGHEHGIDSIKSFNIICALPSQYPANQMILNLYKQVNPQAIFLDAPFYKKMSEDLEFDEDKVLSEPSDLSLDYVEEYFEKFRKNHFGKPFEIKNVNAKLRRYIYNFMGIQEWCKYYLSLLVKGQNILLLDDTIGGGITFREASNLILPFKPRSITSFTVLRDYRKS